MEQVLAGPPCACAAAAALRRRGTAPVRAPELQRRETRAAPRSARARARGVRAGVAAAGDSVGVVLVDHGSRKAESNDQLVRARAASTSASCASRRTAAAQLRLVDAYKAHTGRAVVHAAHMELVRGRARAACALRRV